MSSSINELETRLSGLKKLTGQLQADTRLLSTSLDEHSANDPLIESAKQLKVPMLMPLTIGTLLASALGEVESVENALKSIRHK
ncbi:hypothetical protein [Solimicrobium silvestre]|uniref:Uncharacterized protein n=1 Tax=Solimicrobium silvestre TaxID=2099400 RepID=A0A2S9H4R9_9BURK|nr:hypothetical protein [Solimicrobium silvestre]PRC94980.1 hypothetical protein S2091_0175 [Solimicrobium silvestre]